MPSDSFQDVTKRDWSLGLPTSDPGGGRPWFNTDLNVPQIGDTVLVASRQYAETLAALNVSKAEANVAGGYAEVDASGKINPSLLPDEFADTWDGGTVDDNGTLEQTIDDVDDGGVVNEQGEWTDAA